MKPNRLFLLGLALIFAGCSAINSINRETKRKTVLTGICDNNIKKIEAAFDAASEGMTEKEIAELCFDPTAPNVQTFPGADGIKHMLGTEQARPMIDDPAKYKEHIIELQRYQTRVFPYVKLATIEEGNFWSSSKTQDRSGIERYYIFIYYDGKLLTKKKGGRELLKENEQEEKSLIGGVAGKIFDLGARFGKRF